MAVAAPAARAQVTAEPSAGRLPRPGQVRARPLHRGRDRRAWPSSARRAAARSRPGFAIGARVGYDLTRWLAVQAHVLGSTHQTSPAACRSTASCCRPTRRRVEGKLTYRFGQTSIFAEGGVGAGAPVDQPALRRWGVEPHVPAPGLTAGGGGGIDYHSLSRHFSIGVRGELLLAARHQRQPGADRDHLPEVHVLRRAAALALAAAGRARRRAAPRAAQTVDLGASARRRERLPAEPDVLRQRQIWPNVPRQGLRRQALLRTPPATADGSGHGR